MQGPFLTPRSALAFNTDLYPYVHKMLRKDRIRYCSTEVYLKINASFNALRTVAHGCPNPLSLKKALSNGYGLAMP